MLAWVFISPSLKTQREDTAKYIAAWIATLSVIVLTIYNALTAVGSLRALTDFTLCNARRFNFNVNGEPLGSERINARIIDIGIFLYL